MSDKRLRDTMNECSELRIELMKLQQKYAGLQRDYSILEDDFLILCDVVEEYDDPNSPDMKFKELEEWIAKGGSVQ